VAQPIVDAAYLDASTLDAVETCGAKILGKRDGDDETSELALSCDSPACASCADRYRWTVQQRIRELLEDDDPDALTMWTATRGLPRGGGREDLERCHRILRETLANALEVAREVCRRYERLDVWWRRATDPKAVDEYRAGLPWDWDRDRAAAKAIEQWNYHYRKLLEVGQELRPPTDKGEYVDEWPDDGRPPRPNRSNLTYLWAFEVTDGAQDYERWHSHYHVLFPSRAAAQLVNAAWQSQRPPTMRAFWNTDVKTKTSADFDGDLAGRGAHYVAKYVGKSRSGQGMPEQRRAAALHALREQRLYSAGGDWSPIGMRYEPDDPITHISTPLLAERGHWEAWECYYRPELPSAVSHVLEIRRTAKDLLRDLDEYSEETVETLERALDETTCPDESAREVVRLLRNFSDDSECDRGRPGRDVHTSPHPPPRPD